VAKIQKAAAARAALEAALADEPVRLDALDAALEAARGARGLLDDALLATADAAHQVATDALRLCDAQPARPVRSTCMPDVTMQEWNTPCTFGCTSKCTSDRHHH